MGFLDNLLKKEARKIVAGVLDEVVDTVTDNIRDNIRDSKGDSDNVRAAGSNGASAAPVQKTDAAEEDCCGNEAVVEQRIRTVVSEEWGDRIEIRKNIPSSELGAESRALESYTYGLYCDGAPMAMINLFNHPNLYRKRCTRLAKEACERNHVGYVHFIMRLPNRTGYIREQLKKIVHI